MIKCSSCNNDNADDAKHCGYCGSQLQAQQVKKTMFGMTAIAPEEVERLRKLQLSSSPSTPAVKPAPAAPKPAATPLKPRPASTAPATGLPPKLDAGLGELDLGLPGGDAWNLDSGLPGLDELPGIGGDDLEFPALDPNLALADTLESRKDLVEQVRAATSPADAPKRTMVGMAFDPGKIKEAVEASKAAASAPAPEPPAAAVIQPPPFGSPLILSGAASDELPKFDAPVPIAPRDLRETEPVGHPQPDAGLLGGVVPEPLHAKEGPTYAKGKGELANAIESAPMRAPIPAAAPAPSPMPAPPPRPVGAAVRPPAGLAEPPPRPTPPQASSGKKTGLIVVIVIIVVGLLAALLIGGLLYVVFGGSAPEPPPPTVGSTVGGDETEVVVQMPEGGPGAVVVFAGESREVASGQTASFTVDNTTLQVGRNAFPIEIRYEGGAVTTLDTAILLPARVEPDLSGFEAGKLEYALDFTIPAGASLSVLGKPVPGDTVEVGEAGTSKVRVPVSLEEIAASVAQSEQTEYRHRVFYTVTLDHDDGALIGEGDTFVTLHFARCGFALNNPPPRWWTAERGATLSGWAEPGATVKVEGTRHETAVGDDGRFSLGLELPMGETPLRVVASRSGRVASTATVRVRRGEASEIRAEAQRARAAVRGFDRSRRPRSGSLLVSGGAHEGEPVHVDGRLVGAREASEEAAVLFVDACGADKRCVVAVETTAWLPFQTGDRVAVVGEVLASRSFRAPGQEAASELPTLRAIAIAAP